jgi:hypothetical protein
MLPTVIPQALVQCFSYWQDGIQTGMQYDGEIYTFVGKFSDKERLNVYQMSYDLEAQGKALCITVQGSHYSLWQALRTAPQDAPQDTSQTSAPEAKAS